MKNALDLPKPTLVWTNPNPTAQFPEQTVAMDLSGYTHVMIYYTFTEGTSARESKLVKVGDRASLSIFATSNDNRSSAATFMNTASRDVVTSQSSIIFGSGNMTYAGGAYPGWGNRCIPLEVWGLSVP